MFIEQNQKSLHQAIIVNQTIPSQVENIPLQNLGDTVDQVSESIEILETELHDAGVGSDLGQKDIGVENDLQLQQNLRHLERAHQFIGTMSGQIKASGKISSYDEKITQLTRERERGRVVFSR